MSTDLARAPGVADWIVCSGAVRAVEEGRVSCPLRDWPVPVTACLDCHHLSAMADERSRDRDCWTANGPAELG